MLSYFGVTDTVVPSDSKNILGIRYVKLSTDSAAFLLNIEMMGTWFLVSRY